MPEFRHLEDIENAMYNRILRNSYKGIIKGALIGVAIAVVVGAALGAAVFFGYPALLPLAVHGLWSAMTAGIIAVSAVAVPLAARFGGVAGVQSTRDARRFMHADQLPTLTQSEAQERQRIFALSHSVPERPEAIAEGSSFQEMLRQEYNNEGPQNGRKK